MPDVGVRLGLINGVTNDAVAKERALFQQKYLTEVLVEYNKRVIMESRHQTRTVEGVKSVRWPTMGNASAAHYFIPGTSDDLGGSGSVPLNFIEIALDYPLVHDLMVWEIDEKMNYWETRGQFAAKQGQALAEAYDTSTIQQVVKAARKTTNNVGDALSARQITLPNVDTDSDVMVQALYKSLETLANNDVPTNISDNLSVVLKPAQYFQLAQNKDLISRDLGGSGSLEKGMVWGAAGIPAVMSTIAPYGVNKTAVTGQVNDYAVDLTKTVGLVFHREAIATIRLMGLNFETFWDIKKQGTLFVVKQMQGTGITGPKAAVEILKP